MVAQPSTALQFGLARCRRSVVRAVVRGRTIRALHTLNSITPRHTRGLTNAVWPATRGGKDPPHETPHTSPAQFIPELSPKHEHRIFGRPFAHSFPLVLSGAHRESTNYVFYRQLLKGGAKDTMVSDARGRTTCGRSRSLLRVRESEEVARKSFDRIKSRKGMTRSSAFSLVRTHRRRRTRMSLNEARVPYNNRNRRHTTATNLV